MGIGFTITVAVIGVPLQPAAAGVMVNVTVTGDVVVLVNVPLISPLPAAAIPVAATILFLAQVKEVDGTVPLNTMFAMAVPEQIDCEDGVATASGAGSTTTVAVMDAPGQPLAIGVMVNVTVTGDSVVLISDPLISPEPLAAIPVTVAVLFLVQVKVVPATLPLNTIEEMDAAEQIVCDEGVAVASGVGFTITVAVTGAPGQPLAVGVIVKVTVTGAVVVLVKIPLISPVPLAAIPVAATVLSLVQL